MKEYAEAFNHESIETFVKEQLLKDSNEYFEKAYNTEPKWNPTDYKIK